MWFVVLYLLRSEYHLGSFWAIYHSIFNNSIPHFPTWQTGLVELGVLHDKCSHGGYSYHEDQKDRGEASKFSLRHWATEQEQTQIVVQLGVFCDPGSRIPSTSKISMWSCYHYQSGHVTKYDESSLFEPTKWATTNGDHVGIYLVKLLYFTGRGSKFIFQGMELSKVAVI